MDRCEAPRADLEAGDPWRSYLSSGIVVRLQLEPGRSVWFRVVTRVAGRRVWAWMPQPAGSSRWRPAPPEPGMRLAVRSQRGLLQAAPVESGGPGSALLPSNGDGGPGEAEHCPRRQCWKQRPDDRIRRSGIGWRVVGEY